MYQIPYAAKHKFLILLFKNEWLTGLRVTEFQHMIKPQCCSANFLSVIQVIVVPLHQIVRSQPQMLSYEDEEEQ